MDYVQHWILKQVDRVEKQRVINSFSTTASLYRILLEYQLNLIFACLWNSTEEKLSIDEKTKIILELERPVLGKLLEKVLLLDEREPNVLSGKGRLFRKQMEHFISIRNKNFGHGFLVPGMQENVYELICKELQQIYGNIVQLDIPLLSEQGRFYLKFNQDNTDIVVFEKDDYQYDCVDIGLLDEPGLFYRVDMAIYHVTPFLIVEQRGSLPFPEYDFGVFSSYKINTGEFRYSKISSLGTGQQDIKRKYSGYFQSYQQENKYTICKANGVICNKFENNYDYFISIDPIIIYETYLWDFINKNESNTCITIRGGGGIGKTALVQYVCTKYLFEPFQNKTAIQYVIFCTAKNRQLKQNGNMKGTLTEIQNEGVIRSYKDVMNMVSYVLDLGLNTDSEENIKSIEQSLIDTEGVLLIIDDFETLSNDEKKCIVRLMPRLKVNKHKVIITTRSQYMIGEEYYIPEMDQKQILEFMRSSLMKNPNVWNATIQEKFELLTELDADKERIYALTQGLPLLALQLNKVLLLTSFNKNEIPASWSGDVEEFLLGKLYDYFNTFSSKILFVIILLYCKNGKKDIRISELLQLYKLYCKRFHEENFDYEYDLEELRKLKIIGVESEDIRINNNVSVGLLDRCKKAIMEEIQNQGALFDDKLLLMICNSGIEKGVIAFCESEDTIIKEDILDIFVLENALLYTNDVRFHLISCYVEKCSGLMTMEFLREVFVRSQPYFSMEESFNAFFGNLCIKYGLVIPELESWLRIHEPEDSMEYLLVQIKKELTDISEKIDDYIVNRRKKGIPQSYKTEMSMEIRKKIGLVCNYQFGKLCEAGMERYYDKMSEIFSLIEDISYSGEFNMREYDNCRKLLDMIGEK